MEIAPCPADGRGARNFPVAILNLRAFGHGELAAVNVLGPLVDGKDLDARRVVSEILPKEIEVHHMLRSANRPALQVDNVEQVLSLRVLEDVAEPRVVVVADEIFAWPSGVGEPETAYHAVLAVLGDIPILPVIRVVDEGADREVLLSFVSM